jgi:hypothetical protein
MAGGKRELIDTGTDKPAQAWPQPVVRIGNATVTSVENKSETFGFDAQTEEYGDLVQAGIIDPTKVVRAALQDAATVAGLLITTEALPSGRRRKPRLPCRAAEEWAAWTSKPLSYGGLMLPPPRFASSGGAGTLVGGGIGGSATCRASCGAAALVPTRRNTAPLLFPPARTPLSA